MNSDTENTNSASSSTHLTTSNEDTKIKPKIKMKKSSKSSLPTRYKSEPNLDTNTYDDDENGDSNTSRIDIEKNKIGSLKQENNEIINSWSDSETSEMVVRIFK